MRPDSNGFRGRRDRPLPFRYDGIGYELADISPLFFCWPPLIVSVVVAGGDGRRFID